MLLHCPLRVTTRLQAIEDCGERRFHVGGGHFEIRGHVVEVRMTEQQLHRVKGMALRYQTARERPAPAVATVSSTETSGTVPIIKTAACAGRIVATIADEDVVAICGRH